MRQQADKLKNEGNDLVKQEKYKEALEAYNAAIKIDGNNAIYYCNRYVLLFFCISINEIIIVYSAFQCCCS